MKRIIIVVLFVMMVLIILNSTVFAGGDQNVGDTGKGTTAQIGCSAQPCYSEAVQPQYQNEPLTRNP